jgi:hypothetical protein
MKKTLFFLLFCSIACAEATKGLSELYTGQYEWGTTGTITGVHAALGPTQRTNAYTNTIADANGITIDFCAQKITEIPGDYPWRGINVATIRFITSDKGDSWTLNIYYQREGDKHWNLHSIIKLTGGAQPYDDGNVFVSSINIIKNRFYTPWQDLDSSDDFIDEYMGDTNGVRKLFIIATSIEKGKKLTIQVARAT